MCLLYCQKCGKVVGDNAKFCMSCGAPIAKAVVTESSSEPKREERLEERVEETKKEELKEPVAFDDVVASGAKEAENQEYPEFTYVIETDEVSEEKKSTIEEKKEEWKEIGEQPIYINNTAMPPKKRKKFKLVPALLLCFVLLIGALGIVKGAEIRNFIAKTVSSPEKYYKKVESRELGKVVKSLTKIYDAYTKPVTDSKGLSGKIEIKLDDGAKSLLSLASMSGIDLSWLESGYLAYELKTKDDAAKFGGTIGLKDTGILSFDTIFDLENEKLYLRFPELSKQYVSSSLNTNGSLKDAMSEYTELVHLLPKADTLEKLLNRYIDIALDSIDDVQTKKDTIAVKGIKENASKITVTISQRQVIQVVIAILKEIPKDKEFKELYETLYNGLKDKTDMPTYDELIEEVKKLNEEAMESKDAMLQANDEILSMDIWVDDRGEVIGREFSIDSEYGFRYLTAESNDKTATEMNLYTGEASIVFEGKGKKSGDDVTGDYSLCVNGEEILTFETSKLDVKALKNGEFNGKVRLGIGQGLLSTVKNATDYDDIASMYGNFMNSFSNFEIECDGKIGADGGKVTSTIYISDQPFVKFITTTNLEKDEKFSVPKDSDTVDSMDYEAMSKWESSLSIDQIIKNLKKAGVPQQYLDALQQQTDSLGGDIFDSFGSYLN